MYGFHPYSAQPFSTVFHSERLYSELEGLLEELVDAAEPDGDVVFVVIGDAPVQDLAFAVIDLEQEEPFESDEDFVYAFRQPFDIGGPSPTTSATDDIDVDDSQEVDDSPSSLVADTETGIPSVEDDAEVTEEATEEGSEAQVAPPIRDADPDPASLGTDEPEAEALEVEDHGSALVSERDDLAPLVAADEDEPAPDDPEDHTREPLSRDADPELRQTDEPEEEALDVEDVTASLSADTDEDLVVSAADSPEEEALEPGEEAQVPPAIRDSDPALIDSDEQDEPPDEPEDASAAPAIRDSDPAVQQADEEEPAADEPEDATAAPAIRDSDPAILAADESEPHPDEPEDAALAPLSADVDAPLFAVEDGQAADEELVEDVVFYAPESEAVSITVAHEDAQEVSEELPEEVQAALADDAAADIQGVQVDADDELVDEGEDAALVVGEDFVEPPAPTPEPIKPISTDDGNAFVQYPGPNPLRRRHLVRARGVAILQNIRAKALGWIPPRDLPRVISARGNALIDGGSVEAAASPRQVFDGEDFEILFGTLDT